MTLFAWIIRGIAVFLILTTIYVALTLTNRMKEKDRLRERYIETKPSVDQDDYVTQGMVKYNRSLKAKLLFGVYIAPIVLFGLLIFLAQT